MKKICTYCKIEKELTEFNKRKTSKDGYRNNCKKCRSEKGKKYYTKNADLIKNKSSEWRKNNKDKIIKYRKDNKEKLKTDSLKYYYTNIELYACNNKKWRENNSDKRREYCKQYYKENKHIKVWRDILVRTIYKIGGVKESTTIKILGYSAEDLKSHIECLFEEGMSWSNHGDWHIDHKIPLSAFNIDTPINIINSLDNLQPLWKEDNLKKSDKILCEFKTMYIYKYCY